MLRKFIPGILMICLACACQKTQVFTPEKVVDTITPFKDQHIDVAAVNTEQVLEGVSVTFKTRYERGISKIEVFSGTTKKNLCSFTEFGVTEDSNEQKRYQAIDEHAVKGVNYYMLRYVTPSGDWSYSSIYQIEVK